jgi:hypothetical protein
MTETPRERLAREVRERAPAPDGVLSTHPDGWLHGRVDACTCHGQTGRVPPWTGAGHAPDCPASQP